MVFTRGALRLREFATQISRLHLPSTNHADPLPISTNQRQFHRKHPNPATHTGGLTKSVPGASDVEQARFSRVTPSQTSLRNVQDTSLPVKVRFNRAHPRILHGTRGLSTATRAVRGVHAPASLSTGGTPEVSPATGAARATTPWRVPLVFWWDKAGLQASSPTTLLDMLGTYCRIRSGSTGYLPQPGILTEQLRHAQFNTTVSIHGDLLEALPVHRSCLPPVVGRIGQRGPREAQGSPGSNDAKPNPEGCNHVA